jgi:hypothetical protein
MFLSRNANLTVLPEEMAQRQLERLNFTMRPDGRRLISREVRDLYNSVGHDWTEPELEP